MDLKINLPIPNSDWVYLDIPQKGKLSNGAYYKHGYGCAVTLGKMVVDFDFGDKGEIDGFDVWRLFELAERNRIEPFCNSPDSLKSAFTEAVNLGELRYSGYILYYLSAD